MDKEPAAWASVGPKGQLASIATNIRAASEPPHEPPQERGALRTAVSTNLLPHQLDAVNSHDAVAHLEIQQA